MVNRPYVKSHALIWSVAGGPERRGDPRGAGGEADAGGRGAAGRHEAQGEAQDVGRAAAVGGEAARGAEGAETGAEALLRPVAGEFEVHRWVERPEEVRSG